MLFCDISYRLIPRITTHLILYPYHNTKYIVSHVKIMVMTDTNSLAGVITKDVLWICFLTFIYLYVSLLETFSSFWLKYWHFLWKHYTSCITISAHVGYVFSVTKAYPPSPGKQKSTMFIDPVKSWIFLR